MVRWNKAYIKGTNEVVNVDDELPKGTEFECMACRNKMIRKKGEKRVHHFAHQEKTVKCDPESFFHKLGKKIFKETYDGASEFVVIPSTTEKIDLKKEYGECLIENRQEGKILNQNADLYINHLQDKDKDIIVEILFTHQTSKKKIDQGCRIIEIRIPNKYTSDEYTSDDIEREIKAICEPPLRDNEYVRLYNFEKDIVYMEVPPAFDFHSGNSSAYIYNEECLGTDDVSKSTPKFRNYIPFQKGSGGMERRADLPLNSKEKLFEDDPFLMPERNKEIPITGFLLQPQNEGISSATYFEVSDSIKNKYPNIRHQPAVLPSQRQIIDIIIKDNDKEYWYGIDYRKHEVIFGDFHKKIPDEWKEAVREYIKDLKPIKRDN